MSKAFGMAGAAASAAILFVDDEADLRELVELTVVRMGHSISVAGNLAQARALLEEQDFQFCLTDMRLPDGDGLELLRHATLVRPQMPVAVLTAHGNTENAVAALKGGAFDYLSKPLSLEDLRTLIRSALTLSLDAPDASAVTDARLLGDSPAMVRSRALIARISKSQAPVYVTGESGSGKELAAHLLHEGSVRRGRPFVAVNCGAVPENLMESEFFGYRKGAFTGANEDREGFFQVADGGTLFLDEVADLPLLMQVKLLRAIQEKRVRRVGATVEEPVDVRVICATHQSLAALVEAARFRQDLYYRLAVIELRMPALRECRQDVPMIASALLARIAASAGQPGAALTPAALEALAAYDFPGNVRELENILERAVALAGCPTIDVPDLLLAPADVYRASAPDHHPRDAGDDGHESGAEDAIESGNDGAVVALPGGDLAEPLLVYLDRLESEAILAALAQTGFNRTRAAGLLGITFRALRYRMQRLGIREEP